MSTFGKKAMLLTIMVGAGVLLGMQLAGSGLRTVYGPEWTAGNTSSVSLQQTVIEDTPADVRPVRPEIKEKMTEAQAQPVPVQDHIPVQDRTTVNTPRQLLIGKAEQKSVDVMADKTAGLLQKLSKQGIQWVVSVFDGVTE